MKGEHHFSLGSEQITYTLHGRLKAVLAQDVVSTFGMSTSRSGMQKAASLNVFRMTWIAKKWMRGWLPTQEP